MKYFHKFNFCTFFKVPGRLGLLITLDLIATNVYNSVKAPAKRGFSYIEIWMLGVHIPILLGILEYAILMAMKKYDRRRNIQTKNCVTTLNQGKKSQRNKKIEWINTV